MLAIHPAQVATINDAFSPSEDEVRRAERIVALFKDNPGAGALALDGEMIDKPHLVQARRIIALAKSIRTRQKS
jgi:citrate lyase subunit beta/citryl-CoA lyase